MTVRDSNLAEFILDIHLSDKGIYYFFDGFIIAELNEGVTGNFENSQDIIKASNDFYGDDGFIYISNRINDYGVNPSDWIKFFTKKNSLKGIGIVSNTERSWDNSIIEKLFVAVKFARFRNLYDAIDWAKHINNKRKIKNNFQPLIQ